MLQSAGQAHERILKGGNERVFVIGALLICHALKYIRRRYGATGPVKPRRTSARIQFFHTLRLRPLLQAKPKHL
jgi:hypothetical protein